MQVLCVTLRVHVLSYVALRFRVFCFLRGLPFHVTSFHGRRSLHTCVVLHKDVLNLRTCSLTYLLPYLFTDGPVDLLIRLFYFARLCLRLLHVALLYVC